MSAARDAASRAGPAVPAAIASPCTGVCAIDARSGWCRGCLRTIDEIAAWGALDEPARQAIWLRLPARRAARDAAPREPT